MFCKTERCEEDIDGICFECEVVSLEVIPLLVKGKMSLRTNYQLSADTQPSNNVIIISSGYGHDHDHFR